MSNLKVNTINDASGGSNAQLFGVASPPNSMGFRNRILNGGMVIDQRNAGASIAITTSGNYTVDRWSGNATQNGKYTVQQNAGSVTPPAGFTNYLGAVSSSAYSVGSGDVFWLAQAIEGFNVADLGWGTAGAQSITLSFWVRSSLTGTFGGALRNASANRSYPFTYTINAANTWEFETITIAGDTSGTWGAGNGVGINLNLGLGAGSTYSGTAGAWAAGNFVTATGATSVVGTNGATFYVTGVQLEAGTVASPFERRDYGRELIMCQRYYYRVSTAASNATLGSGFANNSTIARIFVPFPVEMRTEPSALDQTGTASDYKIAYQTTSATCSAVPTFSNASKIGSGISLTVASGLTGGNGVTVERNANTAYFGWSAEL